MTFGPSRMGGRPVDLNRRIRIEQAVRNRLELGDATMQELRDAVHDATQNAVKIAVHRLEAANRIHAARPSVNRGDRFVRGPAVYSLGKAPVVERKAPPVVQRTAQRHAPIPDPTPHLVDGAREEQRAKAESERVRLFWAICGNPGQEMAFYADALRIYPAPKLTAAWYPRARELTEQGRIREDGGRYFPVQGVGR